jgi:hypothetical protein
MISQNCKNFIWLILIDENTPIFFEKKFLSLLQKFSHLLNYRILKQSGLFEFNTKPVRDVISLLSEKFAWVITSRVDSDDLLAKSFIKAIQSSFEPVEELVINFDNGIVYEPYRGLYAEVKNYSNMFISLIEKNDFKFKTVYFQNHTLFVKNSTIKYIELEAQWILVIHDSNIDSSFKYFPLLRKPKKVDFCTELNFSLVGSLQFTFVLFYKKSINRILISFK